MRFLGSWVVGLLAVASSGTAEASGPHRSVSAPFGGHPHGWQAEAWRGNSWPEIWRHGHQPWSFQRIATLPNYRNNASTSDASVSEIVSATQDGRTLVYTDSPMGEIGFVDLTRPAEPVPRGKLAVGGEPTSVAILGNDLALVGVNTSESYSSPSGFLAVVDIASHDIIAELDLGGQPDSVAISPSRRFAAVAVENERDEDVTVDGVEGGLPQAPAGYLAVVDLGGPPSGWRVRFVDLTGLSSYAPDDPEPEFVAINDFDQAVVTLQENNHVAVVDLWCGAVVSDFSPGTQTLIGVDAKEDGIISLSDTLVDVPREPDATAWVSDGHDSYIAIANEGDLFGGSRGFTLFTPDGRIVYDSGVSYEEVAVRHGHYPEDRSENKGSEPEGVAYAEIAGHHYLFVGSERGSFVAIYEIERGGNAEFVQLLPAPLGPEGLLTIPERGLLVASGEEDDPSYGVRSSMMIYRFEPGAPTYPQILSADDADGKPIPWSALSGLAGVPGSRHELLAVWDSYYSESRISHIDTSETPAVITSSATIEAGGSSYDPEGITVAPDSTYWIASEGNASDSRPNRLLHVGTDGALLEEVRLPEEIEACRAASATRGTLGSGFEGVTAAPLRSGGYALFVAQQRGWNYTTPECEGLDDDPEGLDPSEPAESRVWTYYPESGVWEATAYELEPIPANATWVGLSEITAVPDGFIVVERDNRSGDFAELKTLVWFSRAAMRDGVISREDKRVYDLLPAMQAGHGWISDKPEGVGITGSGSVFVVTDNDGVEDWSGETSFLRLGPARRLFR